MDNWLKSKKTTQPQPHAFGNRKVDDYKEKEPKNIEETSQPVIRNQKKQDILLFAYVYFTDLFK
ncbi:hypothetical protein HYE14_01015 [Mycoplasmopsis bovis]|nr:hypothetical protein [Mycoplasmopsis bovis]QQH25749.1 hypothetical protein HYE14_01015 [Mycoplasmopsis bovis]